MKSGHQADLIRNTGPSFPVREKIFLKFQSKNLINRQGLFILCLEKFSLSRKIQHRKCDLELD